jgi:hypothetical protein
MNRVSKILFVSATSVVLGGGAALADSRAPAKSHDGDDSAAGDGSAASEASESADAEPSKDSWPTAAIERPLTAAQGMIEVTPMATAGRVSAGNTSATSEGATIAARYGISNQLELAVGYSGITLNPGSNFKGTVAAGLGFNMIHGAMGGRLDVAPRAGIVYGVAGKTAEAVASADVHYKMSSRLYIGTPTNVPGLGATVKGPSVMGASAKPIAFAVPFAVGFQATPELLLQASTQLASFSIKDSVTTYISDSTPLTIDALYGLSNKMDLRVDVGSDLQHAGDAITVAAGINFRM